MRSLIRSHTTSLYVMPEVLNRASMVRQAHHDNCHPEHVVHLSESAEAERVDSPVKPGNDEECGFTYELLSKSDRSHEIGCLVLLKSGWAIR